VEDADYEGHSFSMLQRIVAVANKRFEVRFVSSGRKAMAWREKASAKQAVR